MRHKWLIAIGVIVVLLILLFYPKIYVERARAGGPLFWNSNEALLFESLGRSGASFAPLTYLGEIIRESLGGTAMPEKESCSVLVFRFTASGVQQYSDNHVCFTGYSVFRGSIYSGMDRTLWKWSGTKFEPLPPDERKDIDLNKAPLGPDFDNIDGWSERSAGHGVFQITLNGQPLRLSITEDFLGSGVLSIDLTRPGQDAQRIWTLYERPRRVSKAEYEASFANGQRKIS